GAAACCSSSCALTPSGANAKTSRATRTPIVAKMPIFFVFGFFFISMVLLRFFNKNKIMALVHLLANHIFLKNDQNLISVKKNFSSGLNFLPGATRQTNRFLQCPIVAKEA